MERLLVVWCPQLLQEQERGREARAFDAVVGTLARLATRVDPVRPGVCAVPTRGPSRYFGGDAALLDLVAEALARGVPGVEAGTGVADGLFAGVLAARAATDAGAVLVAPGGTPAFLAPWPITTLERPELADLLGRLGIRTLGAFAALPTPHVLARFGTDGARCQRVAQGVDGELPGFRVPGRARLRPPEAGARQGGFWGDSAGADTQAAQAVAAVQGLLGPESVVRGRLQGGRSPGQRARLVPFAGPGDPGGGPGGPWPGQVPPPAPALVLDRPLPALLVDAEGRTVGVSGGGMATSAPARLSVAGGPWADLAGWAGPWPTDERWWSVRGRRRQARMQVATAGGTAHLLTRERGAWWLEATYD
ncbi:MAG TPA: hypothetical protein VLZ77_01190 [Acidimicrobiales bacterium]|nr:hypothetical protein [Acidimicrobiales bacterium]